jgi:hypothetical protein
LHPISEYLIVENHEYSKYVLDNKDKIEYVCYGAVEDYIKNSKSIDIQMILTNDFYEGEEIDNQCKNFIKNIFKPTYNFQKLAVYLFISNGFK